MEKIKKAINKNKIELIIAFASTFIWGIFAHAYIFVNTSLSHDSLNEFIYMNDWKISIGRVLAPTFKAILGTDITITWAIGIISLIFLALTVFLLIKIFDIKSKMVSILMSGVLTVNITMISLASTCIHDLDVNSLSILMAVLSVYSWKKNKYGWIYGGLCCMTVLGIYQCNISVIITLIIMCSIMDLIHKKDFKEVWVNGFKGIEMLLLGGILYLALLKIIPLCTNIPLVDYTYNSVGIREITITNIYNSYIQCIKSIITAVSIYSTTITSIIHIVLFIIIIIGYANFIINKKHNIKSKILITVLVLILPFGMNITYILDGGFAHDMMKYAYWFIYVLALLLVSDKMSMEGIKENSAKVVKACTYSLIFIIIFGNIQIANNTYLKKEIESKATYSYMNRVLEKIENTEGYEEGVTEVAFVGGSPTSVNRFIPGFENSYKITGNNSTFAINGRGDRIYYEAYFNYVMLNPIKLAEQEKWDEIRAKEDAKNMKNYPDKECIRMIDNVLVVKLGDI